QRLVGRWLEDGGLRLDCPSCALLGGRRSCHTNVDGTFTAGLRSFGAATRRIAEAIHQDSRHGHANHGTCPDCGYPTRAIREETAFSGCPEYWFRCDQCENVQFRSSVGATGSHPAFRAWLKRERRAALDPSLPVIERDGREAIQQRWTSLTGMGTYEAVRDRETLRYALIAIDGRSIPIDEQSSA
nr:hypothetical protein [Chloroflexia bacterium]